MKKHFLELPPEEFEKDVVAMGESAFRARQIVEWVYKKRVDAFSSCSNVPAELRRRLEERYVIHALEIKNKESSRRDGTTRYHFKTSDGHAVPAVFLPWKDRNSVCISTQIGCAVGCGFCVSGTIKFKRNLSRGEIIEQIMQIEKDTGKKVSGALLMGMGEPLLNYDYVVSALRAMVDFRELSLSRRHVTVSSVGLVPRIRKLAGENLGVRLALSLHAPDDAIRRKFIPDRIPYSVAEIFEAGLYYSRKNRSRLTLEYVLVPGVNDTVLAARKFVTLIRERSRPKDEIQVNLIPCNVREETEQSAGAAAAAQRFKDYLVKRDILATLREPKGHDIGAGCGQLGV